MYHIKDYQAIIFDLGAVLINIDYQATIKAFEDLGIANFSAIFSKAKQTSFTDDYEKGLISTHDFFAEIQNKIAVNIDQKALISAWNAMLYDIPQERVNMLLNIKNQVPTYLLSNTNACHMDAIDAYLQASYETANLKPWFDKVYFSYEINMRKPDAEIFELVLTENKLDAKRTLFIDDSPQHIESARQLGIKCHHLLDHEEITQLIISN